MGKSTCKHCTPHLRQQSTHGDSWGGRRQERGRIVGDRMTEKSRGGGKWVETFENTPLPTFHAPKSCGRTGTYSACILGVRLCCQRHDQLMFRAQSEGRLTWVSSIFSHVWIFCNFNIIFNLDVGPICCRNFHRQPLHQSTRLVEKLLLVELVFEVCVISMELQSFENPYVTLLKSANRVYMQPKRWVMSRYPLRTTQTAKGFI